MLTARPTSPDLAAIDLQALPVWQENPDIRVSVDYGKTVMEAHKGHIELDSTPDRGTTVILSLPWG